MEDADLEETFKKLGEEKGFAIGVETSLESAKLHGKEEGLEIGYEIGFALGVIAALSPSSLVWNDAGSDRKQEIEKAVRELQTCVDRVLCLNVPPSISNNTDRKIQLVRIRLKLLEKKLNFSLGLVVNNSDGELEY